jgi:electron transfer flavoprotein alpha subunit
MTNSLGNVLVYSDDRKILFQLLGKGKELAKNLGGELNVLLIGSDIKNQNVPAMYGSEKTFVANNSVFDHFNVEVYKAVFLKAFELSNPNIILIGSTKRGKELAARVSAALDTGSMTDCLNLQLNDENHLIAERLTFAGSTISTEVSMKAPHIATVPSRTFKAPPPLSSECDIISLEIEVPKPRVNLIEKREKSTEDLGLEGASIIVSAGRGFKKKEDLLILEELAEILKAKVGCSRPISADMGWMEEWIGISGRKVSPKLYLACGISGTIQHAAGIRNSQIIISINEDESANIHEMSDYSLVGDLYSVLPSLIKALKNKIG